MKKFLLFVLYLVLLNLSTLHAVNDYIIDYAVEPPIPPEISAAAAIVMDAQTGFILFGKNIHEPHYPASTTKIMTALLALEQYSGRLYEPVSFSRNAVYSIPWNSSHIAMNEGETLSMEDALYSLLLASANEVAGAIAEHIGGDMESFSVLMNRRASALGADNSHFSNPSGLHHPGQVTTAYDMALITREAIRHPKFLELISTVHYEIPPTEQQPLPRPLLNSNRLIRPGPHYKEAVIGGKTGFTDQARHTLVSYAVQDGRRLITVTLRGEGSRLYADTKDLLAYGFAIPYIEMQLFYRLQHVHTIPVYSSWSRHAEQVGELDLKIPEDVYLELPLGFGISEVEHRLYIPSRLTVPVQAGQYIGRIVYGIRGITMGDVQLRAANTVLLPAESPQEDKTAEYEAAQVPDIPPAADYPTESPLPFFFSIESLMHNYFLTVILPLTIFVTGLMLSLGIFKIHRNRRQARSGRYSVIGSQAYRYRR